MTPIQKVPVGVFLAAGAFAVAGFGALASLLGWSDAPPDLWFRCGGGYGAILAIAVLLSANRAAIDRRVLLWGMLLHLALAALFLTAAGKQFFSIVDGLFGALLGFTDEGARFLFQSFGTGQVDEELTNFVFKVLPTIIFFSSLITLLYHLGVMQWVVGSFAWLMQRTMGTSGAETLSASANIFVGQTEAPLLVKPFVAGMTRSELMAVMVGGFATIAGGVMAAYIAMLKPHFPQIAGHLMLASVMNAPAGLLLAKILLPEEGSPETRGKLRIAVEKPDANAIGAAARGAGEGMQLALNIAAMLLAFIALIALLNALLGWAGGLVSLEGLSLQRILGLLFAPVAWLIGAAPADVTTVGNLIGEKIGVNEFVAYTHLSQILRENPEALSPRSVLVATYALLGFANLASIAIQIGGIGGMAPGRRQDLARLGLRAMLAGSMAAFLSASLAAVLTSS